MPFPVRTLNTNLFDFNTSGTFLGGGGRGVYYTQIIFNLVILK